MRDIYDIYDFLKKLKLLKQNDAHAHTTTISKDNLNLVRAIFPGHEV